MDAPWFRDYDWDHYRAIGRDGYAYETSCDVSPATPVWTVSVSFPAFYPVGKATSLDAVQTMAREFDAKPRWVRRVMLWWYHSGIANWCREHQRRKVATC